MDRKTGYGVDVALNRADDLDKLMIQEVKMRPGINVLDIGSGGGGHAMRLTEAGAKVTAIDIHDFKNEISESGLEINFIHSDIVTALPKLASKEYELICLQRVIHYLKYPVALKLLTDLKRITKDRLYISFSGLGSEIEKHYLTPSHKIETRFSYLDSIGKAKFHISEPICLYSEIEAVKILEKAGWKIDKIWVSAFGNIKAICSKH